MTSKEIMLLHFKRSSRLFLIFSLILVTIPVIVYLSSSALIFSKLMILLINWSVCLGLIMQLYKTIKQNQHTFVAYSGGYTSLINNFMVGVIIYALISYTFIFIVV
jgi:hypothetical protein